MIRGDETSCTLKLLFRHIPAFLAAFLLQGCFTGIEHTPKITAKDLNREHVAVTDEQRFADSITIAPLHDWKPGHRLMVTDSRLSMLFDLEPELKPGDLISYDGYRQSRSITGDSTTILIFTDGSRELRYAVNQPYSRIANNNAFSLPMTVDMQLVDDAARMLVGNTYYITTPLRVDSNMNPITNGRKYVPVTVRGVYPGNGFYPLRIEVADSEGNAEHIAMTVGADSSSTRNFDNIFSFRNPRLSYPYITDSNWDCIVHSKVALGMTTEECRLALGSPRDVHKGQNGAVFFEQWTFDNGAYCIFTDGFLTSFRI